MSGVVGGILVSVILVLVVADVVVGGDKVVVVATIVDGATAFHLVLNPFPSLSLSALK